MHYVRQFFIASKMYGSYVEVKDIKISEVDTKLIPVYIVIRNVVC
jgi:hypothetical protein